MDEREQLAKKLLDAGFPIARGVYHIGENSMGANADGSIPEGAREAYIMPTTDELIKALGEDFGSIMKVQDKFQAMGGKLVPTDKEGQGTWEARVLGETPTESLANLYLALHAPKDI